MNWRAESTGKSPSRPATHWAEIMAKVDPAMRSRLRGSSLRPGSQPREVSPAAVGGPAGGLTNHFFSMHRCRVCKRCPRCPPGAEVEEKLDLYVGQSEVDDQLACFVLEPEMYVDLDDEQLQGRSPEDIF
jgi:hypothetical protein